MTSQQESEAIKPLTLEVAIEYLKRHAWTMHEAVLMLNLIDPDCSSFYELDGKKDGNVSTYFNGLMHFNPDRRNLKVVDWLAWAIKGTDKVPRLTPLSYATQFLAFIDSGGPESLRGLSEAMDQELNELSSARSKQVCAALQQGHKKKATDQQVRTAHKRITKDKVSKAQAAKEINISPGALKKRLITLDLPIPKR
jgi:hypothetical protein